MKYFLGTFDGQGHTISNLVMNSTSKYAGLFGYSGGTTIKNIVMDPSCSITNHYSTSSGNSFAGAIIGKCESNFNQCIIENTVNMGRVTLSGNMSGSSTTLYLGGIAGDLKYFSFDIIVKNCANYGEAIFTGTGGYPLIGGIVGSSWRSSTSGLISIQNCINYGTLSNNTEYSCQDVGGISGHIENTTIENCVSTGRIISNTGSDSFIGGVVGYVQSTGTIITHCLWTNDVGYDNMMDGYENLKVTNSSLITTLNTTTISEMNEYAEKTEGTWSRWVMLHLNGGSVNNLGQDTPIGGLLNSLPAPVKEGESLLVWCVDEECNVQYDPETTDASEVTDLYAFWSDSYFNVTFYSDGVVIKTRLYHFNDTISYPGFGFFEEGHTFGWYPRLERMPGKNIIIEGRSTPNNYTVTFDFDNGTTRADVFPFNDTIKYPEDMKREGYAFNGWSPNPERMPGKNIIIKVQWNITTQTSEFVEIVFGKADLNEEGAREIIEKYVDGAKFTIEKFEKDDSGEVRVIIKFEDVEKAGEFVRSVNENKRADDSIKSAKSTTDDGRSFSTAIHPQYFYLSFLFNGF